MPSIRTKFSRFLFALLCFSSGSSALADEAPLSSSLKPPEGTFQKVTDSRRKVRPARLGACILAVPALSPGRFAWVTICTAQGQPLSNVSLLVNDVPTESNDSGQVSFVVPNAGVVTLSLLGEDKEEICALSYELTPGGLLVSPAAAPAVRHLIRTSSLQLPQLLFAPAVMQPGQPAVILGTGFAGSARDDQLILDGESCDLKSGSPVALLCTPPSHIAIGALKDIYVATASGDSQVLETDIASPSLEWSQATNTTKKEISGKLKLDGTSMPALIEVSASPASKIKVTAQDGAVLGDKTLLVLPGGADNLQSLTAVLKSRKTPQLAARLVSELPELSEPKDFTASLPVRTLQTLEYAEIVKYERRLVAVQAKLAETRVPPAAEVDNEKYTAQQQSLRIRNRALSSMLSARHAILLTEGGTEVFYKQAIDDATGGAYYVLESAVGNLTLIPESPVLTLARDSASTSGTSPQMLLNLPEPRFKLWPPIDNADLVPVPATGIAPALQKNSSLMNGTGK